MKRGFILLIFLILILPLANATYMPKNCSDDEIKSTWDSVFEESSAGITIFTNNTTQYQRCQEYFAYEIKTNETWYLRGTDIVNETNITAIKLNATQEFIDILNAFADIDDTRTLKDDNKINYSLFREQNLTIDELDAEFSNIYKSSPQEWETKEGLVSPRDNDTVYSFFVANSYENNLTLTTAYITIRSDYIFLNLFYTHLEFNTNCTANFRCGNWSECIDGNKTRNCIDLNECKSSKTETVFCNCIPSWNCTDWSECLGNLQIRSCIDFNHCQNESNKPVENQTCGMICTPNWTCTDWVPKTCDETKTQYKDCIDHNHCNTTTDMPESVQSCTYSPNFAWMIFFIVAIIIILILGITLILKRRLKKTGQGFTTQTTPKTPPIFPPKTPTTTSQRPTIPLRKPFPTSPPASPVQRQLALQPKPQINPQSKKTNNQLPTKQELEEVFRKSPQNPKSKFLDKNS